MEESLALAIKYQVCILKPLAKSYVLFNRLIIKLHNLFKSLFYQTRKVDKLHRLQFYIFSAFSAREANGNLIFKVIRLIFEPIGRFINRYFLLFQQAMMGHDSTFNHSDTIESTTKRKRYKKDAYFSDEEELDD